MLSRYFERTQLFRYPLPGAPPGKQERSERTEQGGHLRQDEPLDKAEQSASESAKNQAGGADEYQGRGEPEKDEGRPGPCVGDHGLQFLHVQVLPHRGEV